MQQIPVTEKISAPRKLFILNWGWWAFANFVGGTIGWLLAALSLMLTLGLSFLVFWLIVGIAVGTTQYNILSKHITRLPTFGMPNSRAGTWIGATILGVLLSFLCTYGVQFALYTFFRDTEAKWHDFRGYAVGGLFYGSLQSLMLRWKWKIIALWSFACVIGWSIGALIGLQMAQSFMHFFLGHSFELGSGYLFGPYDALFIAITGITGTFVFGLVTGPFLNLMNWPVQPLYDNPGKPQTAQNDPGSS